MYIYHRNCGGNLSLDSTGIVSILLSFGLKKNGIYLSSADIVMKGERDVSKIKPTYRCTKCQEEVKGDNIIGRCFTCGEEFPVTHLYRADGGIFCKQCTADAALEKPLSEILNVISFR